MKRTILLILLICCIDIQKCAIAFVNYNYDDNQLVNQLTKSIEQQHLFTIITFEDKVRKLWDGKTVKSDWKEKRDNQLITLLLAIEHIEKIKHSSKWLNLNADFQDKLIQASNYWRTHFLVLINQAYIDHPAASEKSITLSYLHKLLLSAIKDKKLQQEFSNTINQFKNCNYYEIRNNKNC